MKTDLKKNEKVILVIKSHWISMVWPFFLVSIGVTIGIFLGGFGYIIPAILICYLLYKIVERNNNIWAVTNLRVIDEFGVFSINSKESPLDKINNVTYNQTITGRIFGFGNVQIQTAAEMIGGILFFAFGGVVEDDIEDDFDADGVQCFDEGFKFGDGRAGFGGGGVAAHGGEEAEGAVAPEVEQIFAGIAAQEKLELVEFE